jgi:hypothetical protein
MMLGLVYNFLALFLPINARDLYKKQIDVKIQCWHSILDSPLSWKEREHAFENLSVLYYEQYVLNNVPDYPGYPYLFDLENGTKMDEHWWMESDH